MLRLRGTHGTRALAQLAGSGDSRSGLQAPRSRLGYREQRELEALPATITRLETEQAAVAAQLADPALYRGGAAEAQRVKARAAAIERELDAAMQRWDALERRAASA